MNFRCRDLNLKVFEFSVDEVQDAIKIVSDCKLPTRAKKRWDGL